MAPELESVRDYTGGASYYKGISIGMPDTE